MILLGTLFLSYFIFISMKTADLPEVAFLTDSSYIAGSK